MPTIVTGNCDDIAKGKKMSRGGFSRMSMAVLVACGICQSALAAEPARVNGSSSPAPVAAPQAESASAAASDSASAVAAPESTAAEVRELLRSGKVQELRTAYNGAYGASLLFATDDLIYYVSLFQGENFWRVIKTPNQDTAMRIYPLFVAQTETLAQAELNKVLLRAQTVQSERLLAERNAQLSRLQADQALRVQQEAQIAEQQAQTIREAQALANKQRENQQQLRALQKMINALQAEETDVGPAASSSNTRKSTRPPAR
jgi:hypothetical protein